MMLGSILSGRQSVFSLSPLWHRQSPDRGRARSTQALRLSISLQTILQSGYPNLLLLKNRIRSCHLRYPSEDGSSPRANYFHLGI